jgi:hypothetical protein
MKNNLSPLAKKLGMPLEEVRRAVYHIERKIAQNAVRRNAKFLSKNEVRLEAVLFRKFAKQQKYIIESMRDLSAFKEKTIVVETKLLEDEIREMLKLLPEQEEIANAIVATSKVVMLKGGRNAIEQYALGSVGISFNLRNERAIQYLKGKHDLMLSDFQGSINKTTKDRVLEIIRDGVNNRSTYTQMAQQIEALSTAGIFSRARGQTIAVAEVGKAYEFGNYVPVDEFAQRTGRRVIKHWQTVGDERVTPECHENESASAAGIPHNVPFASGDLTAPRSTNPKCRCSTGYEVVE